jgi:1-deoxy-D-xylulose-5-phosphate reductoisomerase
MPCILNAANEVVISAFLEHKIGFLQMSDIIEQVMGRCSFISNPTYEQLIATNAEARQLAASMV